MSHIYKVQSTCWGGRHWCRSGRHSCGACGGGDCGCCSCRRCCSHWLWCLCHLFLHEKVPSEILRQDSPQVVRPHSPPRCRSHSRSLLRSHSRFHFHYHSLLDWFELHINFMFQMKSKDFHNLSQSILQPSSCARHCEDNRSRMQKTNGSLQQKRIHWKTSEIHTRVPL